MQCNRSVWMEALRSLELLFVPLLAQLWSSSWGCASVLSFWHVWEYLLVSLANFFILQSMLPVEVQSRLSQLLLQGEVCLGCVVGCTPSVQTSSQCDPGSFKESFSVPCLCLNSSLLCVRIKEGCINVQISCKSLEIACRMKEPWFFNYNMLIGL